MNAEEIVLKLQDLGYEAYFVGGWVRDMLLNIPCKDIDIATNAQPDELIKIFKNEQIKTFGKSFLVTFINGIEVATFRTDCYVGFNHKEVNVEISRCPEEDAKRRDFTINSLFYDPVSKKIIDHVNGQDDLQNGIIRFNGDPEKRIWEDPNRIIRACRFLAKINGVFSTETYNSLIEYSDFVKYIKPERIRIEILKSMEIKKASSFFKTLRSINVLKYIFPSMDNCYFCDGGPYHIESVFEHCMLAGDHASTKNPIIKLTAYLHDVGKGVSARINPQTEKIWFEGHEKTGSDETKKELKKLKFTNEEINIISNLILLHMRISYERIKPKGVRRTLRLLDDFGIPYQSLLRIAICDKMGNLKRRNKYKLKDVYYLVKSFKNEVNRLNPVSKFSDLKINGFDIMNLTGLTPGREVGEILSKLYDMIVEDPEINQNEILSEIVLKNFKKEI